MIDPTRQEIAARSKTVVVKVGTRVLAQDDGTLDQSRVTAIAEQLLGLMEAGRHVVLVSSGAVGSGMGRLALRERPADLAHLQAVAAVGQSRLIASDNPALEGPAGLAQLPASAAVRRRAPREFFKRSIGGPGRPGAQILLTADNLNDRLR